MKERGGLTTDWIPEKQLFPGLNHYYGDIARESMLAAVALMIAGAPFYADALSTEFPLEIIGAVLIVGFAAFTNPFKRSIVMGDAVLTGAGAVIFGAWAFIGYGHVDQIAFILRDAIALVFLFAFYFSLKTLRAMVFHQIGKPDSAVEFRRMLPPVSEEQLVEEEMADEVEEKPDPLRHEKEVVAEIIRRDRAN